jgi:hypothetical protein
MLLRTPCVAADPWAPILCKRVSAYKHWKQLRGAGFGCLTILMTDDQESHSDVVSQAKKVLALNDVAHVRRSVINVSTVVF